MGGGFTVGTGGEFLVEMFYFFAEIRFKSEIVSLLMTHHCQILFLLLGNIMSNTVEKINFCTESLGTILI